MTNPRRDRRRAIAAACALLVAAAAATPAAGFDLPELMALLRERGSGEARFTEERFVSGFERTLRYAGTLSFTAPDRLARQTQTPRPESFVVDGNQLTLERGGRVRTLALDTQPELAAMVDALRGTLAGDAAVLQQTFRTTLAGSRAQWSLTLEPLPYRLLAVVRSVRIDGRQGELRTVEVQLADGDRSVTTIEPLPDAAAPRGLREAPAAAPGAASRPRAAAP